MGKIIFSSTMILLGLVFLAMKSISDNSASGPALQEGTERAVKAAPDSDIHSELHPGAMAPEFSLLDQFNVNHRLSDYRGKWVVLYFYPKDMTPGCTTEACNFRDVHSSFKDVNAVIFGVSRDSIAQHLEFTDRYSLTFPLLSDVAGVVCTAYGVLTEKQMNGRTYTVLNRMTYLINPEGEIAKIYPKVDVTEHAREVLEDIRHMSE